MACKLGRFSRSRVPSGGTRIKSLTPAVCNRIIIAARAAQGIDSDKAGRHQGALRTWPVKRRRPRAWLNNAEVRRSGNPAMIRSEEHTSELQSLMRISYAVFCLKKKKQYERKYTKSKNEQQ